MINVPYDASEKQHGSYYARIRKKRALVELLDGLTYLREIRIPAALERYAAATSLLTATNNEDEEIVRKGINDLHRLRKQPFAEPTAELGLGYLFGWL